MHINKDIDSKQDLLSLFSRFEAGALQYTHPGDGRLYLGSQQPHYDANQAQAEGFLRLLWGAGPRGVQGAGADQLAFYEQGILAGVDPDSPHYWGAIRDFDQFMVELAALDLFLVETRGEFFDTLDATQQAQIIAWISQINARQVHPNNWRFFRILTNVVLQKLGQSYSQARLDEDLALIDSCYVDHGWYFDGNPKQQDYYIAWAFHYYGLLYAHYMQDVDPERSKRFVDRACEFARSFAYWFDQGDGAGVPFGRSLTYKFAESAFWAMLVYTDHEALPWGQIKHLLFGNLRYWLQQDLLRADGALGLGYAYEQPFMCENYNGTGSPYWAMKVFILLAVPETHPFWQTKEQPMALDPQRAFPEAQVLATNEASQNIQLFPVGQTTHQLHAADKYAKFVYASRFGFNVQRGPLGLEEGAFDAVLAVSAKGFDHYQPKEIDTAHTVDADKTTFTWSPQPGVSIKSVIVPLLPWHVRIHVITTDHAVDYADGGFSVPTFNSHGQDQSAAATFDDGIVYAGDGLCAGAFGPGQALGITPVPDVNLLHPHVVIPTLTGTLSAGRHVLIDSFFGAQGVLSLAMTKRPTISVAGAIVTITQGARQVQVALEASDDQN